MTLEEVRKMGYWFNVRHHHNAIEVRVWRDKYIDACWARSRCDAMEAARRRACAHFVEHRLGA